MVLMQFLLFAILFQLCVSGEELGHTSNSHTDKGSIATTQTLPYNDIFYTNNQYQNDYSSNHTEESSGTYDEYDTYVPYRSDTYDQFSWNLMKHILEETNDNIVFSPYSIKLVLALLSEAAGNGSQTQRELVNTLSDIKAQENLRGYYKKSLASLKKPNPYFIFDLATKIYVDDFIEPKQRYSALAQNFYDAPIEKLAFADSVKSADTINSWGSNTTHGHIKQLINRDQLQNKVMLIINAMYFQGFWRRSFNYTFNGEFLGENERKSVQYMESTAHYYYYESSKLKAKILRLPYKGKRFSLFVVLPTTATSLTDFLKTLANDELKRMQWMMEETKVKVTMPKYRIEFKKDLKETLMRLQIVDIFTENASLPGLARGADISGKLKVSNIYQKAGIDVNEQGTEAFASTVIEIENKFGGSSSIETFNANRSFFFFIEDETTGSMLFSGKVTDAVYN